MIVTPRTCMDIVQYLHQRTNGTPNGWVSLYEVVEAVGGVRDLRFAQGVGLAQCRGWIRMEGKSVSRICLTEAGCSLLSEYHHRATYASPRPRSAHVQDLAFT